LISLPSPLSGRKAIAGAAAAALVALAVAAPAGAATGVEPVAGSSDSGAVTRSINFTYSWGGPGLDSGALLERKAG